MTLPDVISTLSKTTANGTAYVEYTIYPNGVTDKALICVPAGVDEGESVVLAMCSHGSGGTEQQINLPRMVQIRDGLLDRGFIVASAFAHDRAWANNAALADWVRLHGWVNAHYPVTDVLLHGESMGGLTMLVLAGTGAVPHLRATVSVDGAMNLRAAYDGNYGAQIRSAYGIASDGSDYAAKTAGHDPCLFEPSQYAQQRIMLSASPADTAIPKVNHSDVFAAHIAGAPRVLDRYTGTGAHVADVNYFPAETLAFYDAALHRGAVKPSGLFTVKLMTRLNHRLTEIRMGA